MSDTIYSGNKTIIRVIYVDDDPDQLMFVKTFLEELDSGILVEPVSSPTEVLNRVGAFDCVVSDYRMPEMDGIQLARKVKEKCDIPFIIRTGQGSEEVASEAFSVGVDDYLQKQADLSHYQLLAKRIRMAVEKQRAEENLRASMTQYKALFDSIPDAILLINPYDYSIISANKAAENQSKIGRDGLVGRTCFEVTHHRTSPCESPECVCPLRLMMEMEQSVTVWHTHFDEDGSPIYVEVSANPVRDEDGNIFQMVHFMRDITRRKRAEEEVARVEALMDNNLLRVPPSMRLVDKDTQEPLADILKN